MASHLISLDIAVVAVDPFKGVGWIGQNETLFPNQKKFLIK